MSRTFSVSLRPVYDPYWKQYRLLRVCSSEPAGPLRAYVTFQSSRGLTLLPRTRDREEGRTRCVWVWPLTTERPDAEVRGDESVLWLVEQGYVLDWNLTKLLQRRDPHVWVAVSWPGTE
jgi:2-polyprenyl-6-methoxyphenol hydroxylase-like FAD-dependent oxidoreductase